ncbi:PAS domain-containing protein [Variovorax sp. YR752]|uniref:hybrid sensor histidine kinase/response regulator n=1 Tax=Variovorax sp. YR752 TaxID=1884383 RepID=UPI00313797BC
MPALPLPDDEAPRLAALRELGLLDTPREDAYDALAATAAAATGCAIGSFSLIDSARQWFKAAHGIALSEVPRENSFCAHTILGDDPMVVADTRADARFRDNPYVSADDGIRFYAGVPLALDGRKLGTLAVMDAAPRTLSDAQHTALLGLARVGVELLRSRRRLRALHEERARLHDLARASGDWMWELDAELRYRWISGQFEPVTGMPPEALLGRVAEDTPLLDAQGQPQQPAAGFLDLLRRGRPFSRAITAKHTPRGRLLVSRSALPIVDDDGRVRGWRGTARDVTVQVDAQTSAARHDELLRKLSSQIPGMLFQFVRHPDGRGEFPFISRGVESVFGVPAERVMANPDHAFEIVHPEDRERVLGGIVRSAAQLSLWQDQYRVTLADGRVRWLETRASPERLPDGSTLWHAFSADVTERQQTELALRRVEARWEMAARTTGLGLAELDLASGRLDFDERACRNHGLPWPLSRFTLEDWLASMLPEDRDHAAAAVRHAVETRGPLNSRARVRQPDGSVRMLEFVGQTRIDAQGAPTGILATCRDVTEQAQTERLRQDKESAERASRAKSEFLSRMSHELRTPLNGILGFAQLMALDRRAPLAPDQQRRLDSVVQAGRHLLDLINDVLDLARIEHQHAALTLGPVDAAAVLSRCLALIAPLAEQADVRLPSPCGAEHWVHADRRALEQVLMNLLSNAIKYNRRGGAVHVGIEPHAGRVRIAVRDEGAGLTAPQRARLFQHFERLGAEASGVPGSGLGLVISRELAQAMGADILVQSVPGEGSTFSLELPADTVPARPQTAAPDAPDGPPDLGAASATPRTVLYIEDEPLNALLMREVFRLRPSWSLHVAGTGHEGLTRAVELRPDAVLIDMNLPDMNGAEVVRRLRADAATRPLRCIALSADVMAEQIEAALAAGFDDYWTKPIDVRLVIAGLDRAFG